MRTLLTCCCVVILCQCSFQPTVIDKETLNCENLIGTWKIQVHNDVRFKFTGDSLHYILNSSYVGFQHLVDGYNCYKEGDSLTILSHDTFFKFHIFNVNNKTLMCNYKKLKKSYNRIDEVYVFNKIENAKENSEPLKRRMKDIFMIPDGFQGVCAVAFNQKSGKPVSLDKNGNRVFKFETNNFLMETKAREDLYNLALSNIEFYYYDSTNRITNELVVVEKEDIIHGVVHKEGNMYVANLGYNQISRRKINKVTNKTIEGNIMFFKIGREPAVITIYDTLVYNQTIIN